jgi:hypothetical protein
VEESAEKSFSVDTAAPAAITAGQSIPGPFGRVNFNYSTHFNLALPFFKGTVLGEGKRII